jgi:hypothetical protein
MRLPAIDLFGSDVPEWTLLVDILTDELRLHECARVVCAAVGAGYGPYVTPFSLFIYLFIGFFFFCFCDFIIVLCF